MKVVVLGTGDLTKIPRHTSVKEEELGRLIEGVSGLLVKEGCELVIIPDRGIAVEVAKIYRKMGGKKVWGLVPTKDKKFGGKHIPPFLNLVDERIELDHWYDVDGEIAAAGDLCVVMGLSPGIMREVSVLKYHYRYLNCKTKVVWFRNTISQPLQKEIVEEIPIVYINSVGELKKVIDEMKL